MAAIASVASAPGESGLFLDFDGVLAPIVRRPEDAAMPDTTRAELKRLTAKYALVAVVSGRASNDLRPRVGVDGVVLVGTHGLELDPRSNEWRGAIADFADRADWPADRIERKGLTAAFHYRGVADDGAADRLADEARVAGLAARHGRKVVEVMPPVEANKGTAVRALVAEHSLTRALVAGDDATDLDAFHALDGLEAAVRVAVASDESPAALRETADIVVTGTSEFLELLQTL